MLYQTLQQDSSQTTIQGTGTFNGIKGRKIVVRGEYRRTEESAPTSKLSEVTGILAPSMQISIERSEKSKER